MSEDVNLNLPLYYLLLFPIYLPIYEVNVKYKTSSSFGTSQKIKQNREEGIIHVHQLILNN